MAVARMPNVCLLYWYNATEKKNNRKLIHPRHFAHVMTQAFFLPNKQLLFYDRHTILLITLG